MPRHRRNRNRPQTERKDSRASYKDIVKENATFEHYYKEQKCFDLNEFDKFLDAMKTPLPAVFRITGYKKHSKQLLTNMKQNYFEAMTDLRIDDDPIKPPQVLPWYPDELAWQTNLNRSQIRRVPQLEKFHAFLIAETESGHITRQEAVSMIPPLLLDVQPHHKVLDMCAAPGSKTAQIVELLHKDEAKPIPEGLCVANDKDNKRCYMLVHQIHRLNSPSTVIVNHDAATFPDLYLNTTNGKQKLEYDRVLCDVPCSGDGTMRKNTDVWLKWNVANSIYLHGTQLRILMRGLELLAEGGQLVYSTCSLNPLEDEAVVAAALSRAAGSVELAPIQLPGLKWSPGVSDWKVMDKHKAWYDNYSQLPESARNIARSMFPPDDADRLNLDRCMRLLPHHQDTGGFFVAVLRKTRTLPWQQVKPQQPSQQVTEERSPKAEVPKKRPRWGPGFKEDPFVFVTPDDMKTLEQIKSFFGFDENFPTSQLLSRTTSDKKKHLYFVSDITKNLVEKNESRLKVINTGVRAFSRCDNTHQNLKSYFRIVQNASECLLQFMSARVVKTHLSDVIKLLVEEQPIYDHFSDDLKESLTQLGDAGSMIFRYEPEDGSAKVRCELLLCGWKGNRAARLYMNKHERVHFLNLCDHVIPAYLLPNKNSRRSREAAAADDVKDVEAAAAGDVVSSDDVMANDRVAVNDDVTAVDDDVVVAAGNGNVAVDADDVITGGDVNGDVTSVD